VDNRRAFLTAIEVDPLDHPLRCAFADWLDEQGEVEEATRQRNWVGAYEYLLENFISSPEETSHFAVLEQMEGWQRTLVAGGVICFGTESMYGDETFPDEFYRNLEIVTGTPILPEARERASFRCAC
jgi:uncharacterized protein (TIGR02996 family)